MDVSNGSSNGAGGGGGGGGGLIGRSGETASEIAAEIQRKAKQEAYLTSGCGYGRKKQKLVRDFWNVIWPGLEKVGWKKVDVPNKEVGSTTFLTPSANGPFGKRGVTYYDKIKDLIDRVLEKRNDIEAKIADSFLEISDIQAGQKDAASIPTRSRRESEADIVAPIVPAPPQERPSLNSAMIDLSWKDGGTVYPKSSSRIGEQYQVSNIPAAGAVNATDEADKNPDWEGGAKYELIWDPHKGEVSGAAKVIASQVPSNKREEIFSILHKNDYSVSNIEKSIEEISPVDGSDWTEAEKVKFASEIFRLRKDLRTLCKIVGKETKNCLAYYLGTYKLTDDYRVLKAVCAQERTDRAAATVHGVDACAICGEGGSLLICDGCEGEYHMKCTRPPLQTVPEGHWECDECVDRKFLEGREYLVRNAGLYVPCDDDESKPRDTTTNEFSANPSSEKEITMRPSSEVLETVCALAETIGHILTRKRCKISPNSPSGGSDELEPAKKRPRPMTSRSQKKRNVEHDSEENFNFGKMAS